MSKANNNADTDHNTDEFGRTNNNTDVDLNISGLDKVNKTWNIEYHTSRTDNTSNADKANNVEKEAKIYESNLFWLSLITIGVKKYD